MPSLVDVLLSGFIPIRFAYRYVALVWGWKEHVARLAALDEEQKFFLLRLQNSAATEGKPLLQLPIPLPLNVEQPKVWPVDISELQSFSPAQVDALLLHLNTGRVRVNIPPGAGEHQKKTLLKVYMGVIA